MVKLRKIVSVGTLCLLILLNSSPHSYAETNNSEPTENFEALCARIGKLTQELNSRTLAFYENPAKRELLRERLSNPYPHARVPVETELVASLLTLLEPVRNEKDPKQYWLACGTMVNNFKNLSLTEAQPSLLEFCRDALTREFPVSTDGSIQHHTMLEMGLDHAVWLLAKHGDETDRAFLKRTERPEFWAERLEGVNYNKGDPSKPPGGPLAHFRGLYPSYNARFNSCEAAPILDKILSRTDEDPDYLRYIAMLRRAAERKCAKAEARSKAREQAKEECPVQE